MATGDSTNTSSPFFSKGVESIVIGDSKGAEFFAYFLTLRENKCVSDFTITCQGQEFSVHRAILIANSDHFRRMFIQEYPVPSSYTIDADPSLLDLVIEYLYSGQLCVAKNRLRDVEEIARELTIVKLLNECARVRLSDLVPAIENCLEMWSVGEALGDQTIVEPAKRMALLNFDSVQETSGFLDLSYSVLSMLVLSKEIIISTCNGRLLAALEWVRHDASRQMHLVQLLQALPLPEMDKTYLRQCLHDPILRTNMEARGILNEAIAAKRAVSRPPTSPVEKFISVAGVSPRRDKNWVDDRGIYLLPTSLVGPHKMFPKLPSSVKDNEIYCAASCVIPGTTGPRLLLSGIGRGRKDVWELHFNEASGEWKQLGRLSEGRLSHAMFNVGGNVYVVGGTCPVSYSFVPAVGVMEMSSGVFHPSGKVRGCNGSRTHCHVVRQTDLLVVVDEDSDHKATNLIEVYSTTRREVTSSCKLPKGSTEFVCGMAVTDEQVIIFGRMGTYTCSLDAVYDGDSKRIQKLSSLYMTPNVWCGVMLSEDRQSVLLIGGRHRADHDANTHPLYRGALSDILGNTQAGWQQVPCSWPLRKTLVISSCCCLVNLPSVSS